MSEPQDEEVLMDCFLDAPPGAVWRAISEPELREEWLGAAGEVVELSPPDSLTLRWTEDDPPSLITFRIEPGESGGACLRIVHQSANHSEKAVGIPADCEWRMAA